MVRRAKEPRTWPYSPKKVHARSPALKARVQAQGRAFLKALRDGYTPRQAAALAGASLWTFQRWLALGHPSTARPGVDDHYVELRKGWLEWKRTTLS